MTKFMKIQNWLTAWNLTCISKKISLLTERSCRTIKIAFYFDTKVFEKWFLGTLRRMLFTFWSVGQFCFGLVRTENINPSKIINWYETTFKYLYYLYYVYILFNIVFSKNFSIRILTRKSYAFQTLQTIRIEGIR